MQKEIFIIIDKISGRTGMANGIQSTFWLRRWYADRYLSTRYEKKNEKRNSGAKKTRQSRQGGSILPPLPASGTIPWGTNARWFWSSYSSSLSENEHGLIDGPSSIQTEHNQTQKRLHSLLFSRQTGELHLPSQIDIDCRCHDYTWCILLLQPSYYNSSSSININIDTSVLTCCGKLIPGIVCKKKHVDFRTSIQIHSFWKYRYNVLVAEKPSST